MDKDALVARLKELRAELARIEKKMESLDTLLGDEVTDETVKQYAEGLKALIDEREPIIAEARELILQSYKEGY